MVPSVFVLFLRLYESPEEGEVEDILGGNEAQNAERRAKEQEMDEALVKEIGDRRRRLGERGIKLTVVLMASAAALGKSHEEKLTLADVQTHPRLTPAYRTSVARQPYPPKRRFSFSLLYLRTSSPNLYRVCRTRSSTRRRNTTLPTRSA
jgi:hypothetical protein